MVGRVEVPQEAFIAAVSTGEEKATSSLAWPRFRAHVDRICPALPVIRGEKDYRTAAGEALRL